MSLEYNSTFSAVPRRNLIAILFPASERASKPETSAGRVGMTKKIIMLDSVHTPASLSCKPCWYYMHYCESIAWKDNLRHFTSTLVTSRSTLISISAISLLTMKMVDPVGCHWTWLPAGSSVEALRISGPTFIDSQLMYKVSLCMTVKCMVVVLCFGMSQFGVQLPAIPAFWSQPCMDAGSPRFGFTTRMLDIVYYGRILPKICTIVLLMYKPHKYTPLIQPVQWSHKSILPYLLLRFSWLQGLWLRTRRKWYVMRGSKMCYNKVTGDYER